MHQTHLTELTAADASLIREEHGSAHMHVGGVAVFAGPPPPIEELRAHVLRRLERLPRYRTTLLYPPLGIGRPRWVEDPTFNVDYHVRHTALPSPGDPEELRIAAARIFSQRLDRSKPLWELWMIEGLEPDRFAVVTKTHQALVDGVVAVDLMTALLDGDPTPSAQPSSPPRRWIAPPPPSTAQLVVAAVGDASRNAVLGRIRSIRSALDPGNPIQRLRDATEAINGRVASRLSPAPPSPLNVPIGPHRRLAYTSVPFADLKRIKDTFGGTVNDVVLVAVTGAIRYWMHERGLQIEDLELRAAVPVAVEARAPGEARPITMEYAPLPVGEPDPLQRLDRIRRSMAASLAAKQTVNAGTLATSDTFTSPTVLAQASRVRFAARYFNLLVTNVPGPREAMYLRGRRMQAVLPIPFLSGDRALAIAATSYAGNVHFGLLADLDKLPDLEVLTRGIELAVAELLDLADAGRPPRRNAPSAPL